MDSIAKTEQEAKFLELARLKLDAQGFRVVDADCHVATRSFIRLFVERIGEQASPNGQTSLDDCAQISSLIGPMLEVEDWIPGAYDFEVSSPGLDRRLRLREDFETYLGEEVRLRLHEAISGIGIKPRGTLLKVSETGLSLEISGQEVTVPFAKIRRANLVWKS